MGLLLLKSGCGDSMKGLVVVTGENGNFFNIDKNVKI